MRQVNKYNDITTAFNDFSHSLYYLKSIGFIDDDTVNTVLMQITQSGLKATINKMTNISGVSKLFKPLSTDILRNYFKEKNGQSKSNRLSRVTIKTNMAAKKRVRDRKQT